MTIAFKSLIKKMATDPANMTHKDYEDFNSKIQLFSNELTHMVILVNSARFEVILTHLTANVDAALKQR